MSFAAKITIIIVSYNSHRALKDYLGPSLSSGMLPVIIIDNASNDNSPYLIKEYLPFAKIIKSAKNIGYGRAANLGLSQTVTPYALLLNPDILTSQNDIFKLIRCALNDTDNTAIWGPATPNSHRSQSPSGSVNWVSGCAMLFNMKKMQEVGFFDENIFLYFEETDLCKRTIECGFLIKLCGHIYFDHKIGAASTPSDHIESLKTWHYGWSKSYYYSKHYDKPKKQHLRYNLKRFTATSKIKREKYRHLANGSKAFLAGIPAFDDKGYPQIPDKIQQNRL